MRSPSPRFLTSFLFLICSLISGVSCKTHEIDTTRVERVVVAYDQSEPMPLDSGIKVALDAPVSGVLFQPGKEPEQVSVAPGTFVLQGVNVYRRMFARVSAFQQYLAGLPEAERGAAASIIAGFEADILAK